jgi:glycylpeptide N-tetradecanoyltransferase
MDNVLFLDEQKFGAGDGNLHYYLYNYRAQHVPGGTDHKGEIDDKTCSGVGLVML